MRSDKRPLIFFSGGLDSTALLYERLKTTNVDVAYANGNQHPIKAHVERECRRKIITAIEAESSFRVIERLDIPAIGRTDRYALESMSGTMGIIGFRGPQQMAWFLAALWAVNLEEHSCVEIGIVMGDSSAHVSSDFSQAWCHLIRVCKADAFDLGDRIPRLCFPLLNRTKKEIYQSLPSEIRDLTWTCESPRWITGKGPEACGQCAPCITYEALLKTIDPKAPYYSITQEMENYYLDHGTPQQKRKIRAQRKRDKTIQVERPK